MMNLRFKTLATLLFLGSLLWGCHSVVYEDMSNCPQGVYVKFYSMTSCETTPSFIGSVPSLTVFAFDKEGKLVQTITERNVTLTQDYEILFPVSDGQYTFVAWAGLNDHFTKNTFTNGVTTKKDVLTQLKTANDIAPSLNGTHVWQGESAPVFLPDPAEHASYYEHTAINMQELTNRVKLIVEFDKTTMKQYDTKKLHVELSSANSTYLVNGQMPHNGKVVTYPATPTYNDNIATWDYYLMDLKTGYNNKLHIYYTGNKPEGETVFQNDLIALILLAAKNGNANLDCDNDFEVKVVVKDYCVECWTHFSCSVYINDWLVHSYSTELQL